MFNCLGCGAENKLRHNSRNKFCNNKCQQELIFKTKVESWLKGEIPGYRGKTKQTTNFVKRYLWSLRGTSCEVCGWDERHPVDGAVLTEIDHIDGNASNSKPENLRILCPNCHSMTPTFRARNKGSERDRK